MRGWITETVRFEAVGLTGRKTCACAGGCGRRLKRQRRFEQTLNPWNRTAAGQPKTAAEILAEVRARIAKWEQEPETCTACQEAGAA